MPRLGGVASWRHTFSIVAMKNSCRRLAGHALLSLTIVALSIIGMWFTPADAAHAAPAAARGKATAESNDGNYLDQLLHEINTRRSRTRARPLAFAPADANRAVDQYLADLTPVMMSYGACFHGNYNPVPPSWDYVAAAGHGGDALGEVMACPDDSGYWTAQHIADSWWQSPIHHQAIYSDRDANMVACGTFGPKHGGQAFVTIACVTFRV
jgi:hypothetical protein